MRYTLKDYQADAVGEVLDNLRKAARDWKEYDDLSAFSLTATTGAGKTVMAASVIESLFAGSVEYDFEPDPGAVVLWFTDDPSLNEQTRLRIMSASDRINSSQLVVIENTFSEEKLKPGKVYFLNSQKLSKRSRLVRGAPEADDADTQIGLENMPPPDDRAYTMWDILRNTIDDKRLTLYLILDEAHRGMRPDRDRGTTVQRLINGRNGSPPVPVVFGISATVQRFNDAMRHQHGRTMRSPVVVDPARVQESGLLKDDVRLDFPTEAGAFDTALLARATRKLRQATERWQAYHARQASREDEVVPLMVVQAPNKPSDEMLADAIATIRHEWPEIGNDAMANVFGEHQNIEVAGFKLPYVHPQVVQHRPHIRVLFAKDAISTGWDCPRAEVFVSFRPARDGTYITQLLGRMVRTPLARRVPGNDLLNSVECILPQFNREAANRVAAAMIGDRDADNDETGGGEGRRVLMAPVDMAPNPAVPAAVWQAFDTLPSQTLPRKRARPVTRLTALAQALSRDGLREGAVAETYSELCRTLDAFAARFPDKLKTMEDDVKTVDGATLVAPIHVGGIKEIGSFEELADDRAIEAQYKAAGRKLTRELARRHAEHIAGNDDDELLDAHIKVAALGKMEGVVDFLDEEADRLATKWFDEYRVAIKGLGDERQTHYDSIKGMSSEPQRIGLKRPRVRTEETEDKDGNKLKTRPRHLMADENGAFPVGSLNSWEIEVVDREMQRSDALAWYRNPSRASVDALAVAWEDSNGNWRRMCPDFLFFHGSEHEVKVSIVDPHGTHLSDAVPKLQGLAEFSGMYGDEFHRIEALAMTDDGLRVLDLKNAGVREAIEKAQDAASLYQGALAANY